MNAIVSAFMSTLHKRHLKGLGYTKSRFIFSRTANAYIEHVRLKGSSWNSLERPWSFTIDFGVEFQGNMALKKSSNFPQSHTDADIQKIAIGARGIYELRHNPSTTLNAQIMDRLDPSRQIVAESNESLLQDEIVKNIQDASNRVASVIDEVHRICLSGDYVDQILAIERALIKNLGSSHFGAHRN